ncbi:MAG: hypothetical protein ABTR07_12280 [Candidatus Competibacter denitrificans]
METPCLLFALPFLVLLAVGAVVIARIGLQIAWRCGLTSTLVSFWLKDWRFY